MERHDCLKVYCTSTYIVHLTGKGWFHTLNGAFHIIKGQLDKLNVTHYSLRVGFIHKWCISIFKGLFSYIKWCSL